MKIAIIARHFPPSISGGARRPHVLVKSLELLGHETFTIAPQLPDDVHGLAVMHPEEEYEDTGIVRPPLKKDPIWRIWQRNFLLWPDPDRWWANQVVEKATETLARFKPDILITTSPPESIHHAGFILSTHLQIKWIGDFRDSWLNSPLRVERENVWRKYGETLFARKCLKQVDLICAPTNAILNEMKSYAPKAKTYLYPQLAFPPSSVNKKPFIRGWSDLPSNAVKLLHLGSFSLSDPGRIITRTLTSFFNARQKNPALHLCLAGRLSEDEYTKARSYENVHCLGLVKPEIAASLFSDASALLLVARDGTTAVPGKLSEYALTGCPIIVIGDGPWRQIAEIPNEIEFDQLELLQHHINMPIHLDPLAETNKLVLQLE